MKAIRTLIRTQGKKDNDKSAIVYFEYNRHRFSTGERVKPGSWEGEKVSSKFSGSQVINNRLSDKKRLLIDIIKQYPGTDAKEIGRLFQNAIDNWQDGDPVQVKEEDVRPTGKTFSELVDQIKNRHKGKLSSHTIRRLDTVKTKILEHDPGFTINKFTPIWWSKYESWCTEQGNTDSTINTDTKSIRLIIKDLKKHGHKIALDIDDVNHKHERNSIKGLTWSQVKAIADLDLSGKTEYLTRARDFFLIACYTGRRATEIQGMTRANFYQDNAGRWRYTTSRTKGGKKIDIPLLLEAIELFKRLNWTVPKITQQNANRDIKKIAGKAGIDSNILVSRKSGSTVEEMVKQESDTVHLHTGRHSYALRLVELSAGMTNREKWISAMLGHAGHVTTWGYIDLHESQINDMYDRVTAPKKSAKKSRSRKT